MHGHSQADTTSIKHLSELPNLQIEYFTLRFIVIDWSEFETCYTTTLLYKSLALASEGLAAINKCIGKSLAGRKYNRRFYKAQLQSGQDKQLSTSNLNFNKLT